MQWTLEKTLSEFKNGVARLYKGRLKGLYLFGSYARGEARPDSERAIRRIGLTKRRRT